MQHPAWLQMKRKELLELAPAGAFPVGLKSRKLEECPCACQAAKSMLLGQVSRCVNSISGLSHQRGGWSTWGSCGCSTCSAEGSLGRCHLPALSPAETAPSSPWPSGSPPTAGKSFKLLPLCWVSVGPGERAVLHRQPVSRPARAFHPSLVSSPATDHQDPMQCGRVFLERIFRARCAEVLGPCPLLLCPSSPCLWARMGEGWVPLGRGSAPSPFSVWAPLLPQM